MDLAGNKIGETIQTCSYLCTRKCDIKLPGDYSGLVLNKEDFDYMRPVLLRQKKKFEFLTYEEIQKMTDTEKETYYFQKEENITIDPLIAQVYEDMDLEDMKTFHIENTDHSCSDSGQDDY
tara:strand:- start:32 stop:394 length:363 start_codon:yes stop_codon:yes gene_type:complete